MNSFRASRARVPQPAHTKLTSSNSSRFSGLRSIRARLRPMADLVVPQLGESISEAVVAKWLKQVGDAVADGEPVAELETDKITVELPSPVAGALTEQRAQVGATVKVGDVIGAVDAGKAGKTAPAPAKQAPAAQPAPKPQPRAAAAQQ